MTLTKISTSRIVYPNGEEVVTRHVSDVTPCLCTQCGEHFMAESNQSHFFCSYECDMEFQGIELQSYEWESPFPDFFE